MSSLAGLLSAQAPASAPPLDTAAIEQFLLKAKVLKTRPAGKGITGSLRATLSDGTLTHDAQIQTVDESRSEFRTNKGVEKDFRDTWSYNIAAYRIANLLDLRMVPPSVERRYAGKDAAFTWWLDDVMMDEGQRLKDKVQPPNPTCWLQQMFLLRMFDALIDNSDRNLGNTLYTKDWKIWAIDHTRAFRRSPVPPKLESLARIDRQVFEKLEAFDFPMLKKAVGRYLTDAEIRLVLSRRDALVKRYSSLGAEAVYDRAASNCH